MCISQANRFQMVIDNECFCKSTVNIENTILNYYIELKK